MWCAAVGGRGCGCPGLFKGRIRLPLPLSCDSIHFLFGVVTAFLPDAWRCVCVTLFVGYQAVEELPARDPRSFAKDVTVFLAGLALGLIPSVWMRHAARRRRMLSPPPEARW